MDIISQREFEGGVFMKVCYDAEDALARFARARIRTPNLQRRAYLLQQNRLARWIRRLSPGVTADMFFGIGPEVFLFLMDRRKDLSLLMRDRFRRKYIYCFDSWEPSWSVLVEEMKQWRNIGCIWMSSRQAKEYFEKVLPHPITWLPQAADPAEFMEAERFVQSNSLKSVFNIGRSNRQLDKFFESFCNSHNFSFSRQETPGTPMFPVRSQFVRQLVTSQIVVVHPRDLDEPEVTGCVSMITARYFEAYNSGAVVCGFKPTSGEFEDTFGELPFVEYNDPVTFERRLLAELERPAVWRDAQRVVRARHSWDSRAKDLVDHLRSTGDH